MQQWDEVWTSPSSARAVPGGLRDHSSEQGLVACPLRFYERYIAGCTNVAEAMIEAAPARPLAVREAKA
jgi:hypothetical protein